MSQWRTRSRAFKKPIDCVNLHELSSSMASRRNQTKSKKFLLKKIKNVSTFFQTHCANKIKFGQISLKKFIFILKSKKYTKYFVFLKIKHKHIKISIIIPIYRRTGTHRRICRIFLETKYLRYCPLHTFDQRLFLRELRKNQHSLSKSGTDFFENPSHNVE